MRPSGIGGMAVMEGVMMKNKDEYAVAVRKPNNEIAVEKSTHKDFSDRVKLFKLPIFRGMLAFVDSMVVGVKVLNYSASFFEEEEDQTSSDKKKEKTDKKAKKSKKETEDFDIEEVSAAEIDSGKEKEKEENTAKDSKKEDKSNALMMLFAVLISIVMSITLFMVIPVLLTNLLSAFIKNTFAINLIEGILRLAIFIGYVILAAMMPEIKRVFMYHGAEHKTINCLENGFELTVENVKWQSKQHKRCGTSFMLLVILISLLFFMIIPTGNLLWRLLSRIILVPFIAGVSYEFIRLAGKSENKIVNIISKPGLWMQALTTKEPNDEMIEVAIESVGAVFDWRAFLEESAAKETKKSNNSTAKKPASAPAKQNNAVKKDNQVKAVSESKENAVPAQEKPVKTQEKPVKADEEDDEILKALDKFFDSGSKNSKKAGDGK